MKANAFGGLFSPVQVFVTFQLSLTLNVNVVKIVVSKSNYHTCFFSVSFIKLMHTR